MLFAIMPFHKKPANQNRIITSSSSTRTSPYSGILLCHCTPFSNKQIVLFTQRVILMHFPFFLDLYPALVFLGALLFQLVSQSWPWGGLLLMPLLFTQTRLQLHWCTIFLAIIIFKKLIFALKSTSGYHIGVFSRDIIMFLQDLKVLLPHFSPSFLYDCK